MDQFEESNTTPPSEQSSQTWPDHIAPQNNTTKIKEKKKQTNWIWLDT